MKNIYAMIGDSTQVYAKECPEGYILMQTTRPEGDFIADSNGLWIDNTITTERNRHLSAKEFMELFTLEELIAIHTHAESTINVKLWLNRLVGAEYVVRTDTALQEGMAYMVYQNLLSQERHNIIMAI